MEPFPERQYPPELCRNSPPAIGVPVPVLVVRFPDGSKEFRYPDRPLEVGDAVWHDGNRYHVVSISDNGDGKRLTIMVEPDPQSLGDIIGSEEGAFVLELA
jgi:hypothetical protein